MREADVMIWKLLASSVPDRCSESKTSAEAMSKLTEDQLGPQCADVGWLFGATQPHGSPIG